MNNSDGGVFLDRDKLLTVIEALDYAADELESFLGNPCYGHDVKACGECDTADQERADAYSALSADLAEVTPAAALLCLRVRPAGHQPAARGQVRQWRMPGAGS